MLRHAVPLLILAAALIACPGTPGSMAAAVDPDGGYKSPGQSNDGQNRRVRVHNQTGWTMTALYVSDARRSDWRGDFLAGDAALASGENLLVNMDDGARACIYVLRAEFANGQVLERADVNACRIADYYFTR